MKIFVTYARDYSIQNETGLACGVTFNYYITDNFNPIVNQDGSFGYRMAKGNLPINLKSKFISVPGFYEANFDYRVGTNNRPVLVCTDVDYIDSKK